MNYIISGGAGFIGQNLVTRLPGSSRLSILDKRKGCDLCRTSIEKLQTMPPCNIFVHLAALTDVRKSLSIPQETIIDNCKMTLNCLNYAREHNSHFIFTSSMGASEALSPYSASKLACEAFCTAYRKSFDVRTTVLRLSNVYGPHSIHKTSVVAKFIKQCIDKEDLEIFGDGLQTRDFIHVDDVTKAIIDCKDANFLNIASGEVTSIISIAEIIRHNSVKFLSHSPDIKFLSSIKGEINKVWVSTDIKPTISILNGIESTFKWFMENYNGKSIHSDSSG